LNVGFIIALTLTTPFHPHMLPPAGRPALLQP